MYKNLILFFLILGIFTGCSNKKQTPKPKSYFRIDFPQKKYKIYENNLFSFEYPEYCSLYQDPNEKNWFYITNQKHKATIYITYKDLTNNLDTLIENSREFVYKHTIKADAIIANLHENRTTNVYGILYDIKGNAASPIQFFITDSTKHFIRGSLYFECRPNKDSLAPDIKFFRSDIVNFIETLRWK